MDAFASCNPSTRWRTKERQSAFVSISGSARRGRLLRAAITSVVTVLVLLLVWRLFGGNHLRWQGINPSVGSIALAAFGAACFLVGRAWRFAALLPRREGSARELLGATAASWGAGLLLPGPSADITFVALARTRFGVGVARGSGSAIVARILDVVSLSLIAVVASFFTGDPRPPGGHPGRCAGIRRRSRRAPLADHPGTEDAGDAGWRRASRSLPGSPRAQRPSSRCSTAARGGRTWSAARSSAGVATVIQYAALMSMVGLHLGFWQTWFVLSIRTLLLTIPIQGIAGIGTGQAWWAGALLLEGVPGSLAVGCRIDAAGDRPRRLAAGCGHRQHAAVPPEPRARTAEELGDADVSDENPGHDVVGTPTRRRANPSTSPDTAAAAHHPEEAHPCP